ncbi:hypothetical protein Tco_1410875 [Tanacetum coccineum]
MEVKLKIKKRKVVVSDSDKEDGGEQDVDLDALRHCTTVLTSSSIPANLNNLLGVLADVSRLEMTERRKEIDSKMSCIAANYSDAAWDIILARLQANPDLSSIIFGVDFTNDDFAAKMVTLVNSRRKELAEQRAQERRDRPMTPAQLMQYMRTYVKNQGPVVYTTKKVDARFSFSGIFQKLKLKFLLRIATVEGVEVLPNNCILSTTNCLLTQKWYQEEAFRQKRTYYPDKKAEGVGLFFGVILKILMDSPEVNDGDI